MTAAANTLPPITFGEGCDTDTLAYILSKIQGLVFDAHVRDGKGTLGLHRRAHRGCHPRRWRQAGSA